MRHGQCEHSSCCDDKIRKTPSIKIDKNWLFSDKNTDKCIFRLATSRESAIKRWTNHQMVCPIALFNPPINFHSIELTVKLDPVRSHTNSCVSGIEKCILAVLSFMLVERVLRILPPIKTVQTRRNGTWCWTLWKKKRSNERKQQKKNEERQNHIKHLSWANIERVFVCRGGSHWVCIHQCIRGNCLVPKHRIYLYLLLSTVSTKHHMDCTNIHTNM